MQDTLHFDNINTQALHPSWLPPGTLLHVLRLDKIHPVVSGNKWFKLKYYLQEATQNGCDTIATFGGAYSNHIIATAYASKVAGLNSIGVIRGERPAVLSHTLQQAEAYGMQLRFVTKDAYRDKNRLKQQWPGTYWVNEGGYGSLGASGTAEILQLVKDAAAYTHIVCAVGTGTMFAGIAAAAQPHQLVTGVSVLKNNFSITAEVQMLLPGAAHHGQWRVVHDYHFGGYAKHPPELMAFMAQIWRAEQLPTDIVYTAKTLYAIQQMVKQGDIPPGSRVLMIHSGGLQGNLSLPAGVLPF